MARAGQAQANAALAQARTSLGYTLIHAPFAGVVTEKKADPGTLASPGMPLFTIEDTRNYRLEVTVDENDIRIVRAGQSASVSLDALGNAELSGKVVQIVPAADPASRSFLVKIGLPADAHIHSGLFGRARFPKGERQTLLIPRAAIVEHGQLQGVYVVDANRMSGVALRHPWQDHRATSRSALRVARRRKNCCRSGNSRIGRQADRVTTMSDPSASPNAPSRALRLAGRIAHIFIQSKLTPLFIVAALLLGAFSILQTPREEEPQIVVPMLDVFVQMPGASAEEVAQRATVPMEKLLREVPGVEYIYSISHPGLSMVIVRFYVGTKEEDAIVQTYNKLYSNFDRIPQGVSQPIIKPRSIDDVPILALTLWGKNYDAYQLRRIAAELEHSLKQLDDVSETTIIGGQTRKLRVVLDTQRLAAYGLTSGAVVMQLGDANTRSQAGSFARDNREFQVEAGNFFTRPEELQQVVVGVHAGRPVYLRDVVDKIEDGPAEPDSYVLFANAKGTTGSVADPEYPAVTITLAKRKGANATLISEDVLRRITSLRGDTLPNDLNVTVTRNYGETAKDKSDELLQHLFIATISVTLLIALALGWRESGVVLLAIPVTLALTLAIFYFYGYTLNRVTLFALIFSIGILVDDAIVVVENIVRHFRLPENRGRVLADVAVEAVDEVGNPTILATFAVIAAILPMAFVRGLMGPYMRPIPVGASSAMVFSLIVAFVVSPWAALRLLHHYADRSESGHEAEGWTTRFYRRLMNPLIHNSGRRWLFLGGVVVLLLAAVAFIPLKWVQVKMLPFDNKSEFQVIIDMPDGTPLEQTTRVAQALGSYLGQQPEVINYQIYSGTSGPYNFNGLVRHYFLRRPAESSRHPGQPASRARIARRRATTSRAGFGLNSTRSPLLLARESRSLRFLPDRQCSRLWSRKCTGRTTRAKPNSQQRSKRFSRRRRAWWTSTGTWKIRKPSTTSRSISIRPPCKAFPRRRSLARCRQD